MLGICGDSRKQKGLFSYGISLVTSLKSSFVDAHVFLTSLNWKNTISNSNPMTSSNLIQCRFGIDILIFNQSTTPWSLKHETLVLLQNRAVTSLSWARKTPMSFYKMLTLILDLEQALIFSEKCQISTPNKCHVLLQFPNFLCWSNLFWSNQKWNCM